MKPQELSNCLWAAAKLQGVSPEVLYAVPALAKSIPDKVEDMTPQQLSNSLWAAAKLQSASPEVLEALPALARRIPDKVQDMILRSCQTACGQLPNCKIQHPMYWKLCRDCAATAKDHRHDGLARIAEQLLRSRKAQGCISRSPGPGATAHVANPWRDQKISTRRAATCPLGSPAVWEQKLAAKLQSELVRRQC